MNGAPELNTEIFSQETQRLFIQINEAGEKTVREMTEEEYQASLLAAQQAVADFAAANARIASVSPRQARLALALTTPNNSEYPTMLAELEAAFEQLPEPDKTLAKISWEYSTSVERSNPLIAQMQSIIGFTDEQIDQLFAQAATL